MERKPLSPENFESDNESSADFADDSNVLTPRFPVDGVPAQSSRDDYELYVEPTNLERVRGFVADHKVVIGGVIGAIGIISALKRHYKNPGHNID